jgi:hypothetical protein
MFDTERNQPMRVCAAAFRILALNIGNLERHVDKTHAKFERCLMHGIGCKCRADTRCDATMPPCNHLAVLVEASLDAFRRDGVQEVVTNVIFPRPLHLHWRAKGF